MKVLHISGARSWGGNEQQLVDLINELEKLNVKNIVFGMNDSPLHHFAQANEIKFLKSKGKKLQGRENIKYLNQILKETKPDVIHLHTSNSVTLYVLADLFYNLKVPTVFSKKGMGSSMSILSRYKYNYKGINKIICVSERVKKDLQEQVIKEKNYHKLKVVYDGISLKRAEIQRNDNIKELCKIPYDFRIIGNIANHTKAKDLNVLIKMMDYLVNSLSVKNIHLVQIGKFSNLTDDLKTQIITAGLDSYITLAGFQERAMDFISQFEIYVMSSEREGLPLTIYESFFKKIPVVSTKAGGIPEVIVDGQNGFLTEIKDYKTLAEKVSFLIDNQQLKLEFSEKSQKKLFENFTASISAEKTYEIYKSVL